MGSTFACLTLAWLFDWKNTDVMLTQPVGSNPESDLKVVAIETITTFMYTLANCGARADPRAIKELGGVAVGASVFFIVIFSGKITGASMNPARSLGPAIIIKELGGVAVAASVFFIVIFSGKITGASMNPARSLGPLLTVFIGTYTFIFIGCGSLFMENRGDLNLVGIAFAWSSVVMANIYTFGHISGAHINPALTFAYAIANQFPWKHVPLYVVAELMGSTFACLTLAWLFDWKNTDVMLTQPVGSNPESDLKVVAIETITTFMYTLANCGARADPRAIKELGGVAVGASIFFIIIFSGKITGASMNPARSLGPAIINLSNNYKYNAISVDESSESTDGNAKRGRGHNCSKDKKINYARRMVPLYVVAELMGSTFACLTLAWLFDWKNTDVMLTQPVGSNPESDLKVVAIETITTFMYTLANCGARADPRAIKELGGVAVGASVFFIVIFSGKITGASMNPARSLGPAIIIKELGGVAVAASVFFIVIFSGKITGAS
ncbi:hypothetical protein HPP92_015739 [Vanilla planifolia]|uniref:Uncharacterized protein n=1 Tax=Vanilla planifolia TaxID=51239 RepID=A0A835QGU2_VANPL|nr:hypothetical protein HPP92_015739 [Vanilla planifolia]